MKPSFYILFPLLISSTLYSGSIINVHNTTETPVYATIYCKPLAKSTIERLSPVVTIGKNESSEIARPERTVKCRRLLVFSHASTQLKEKISKKQLNRLASISIGVSKGFNRAFDNFYISIDKDKIKGYNPVEWKGHKAKAKINDAWSSLVEKYRASSLASNPLVSQNTHQNQIAQVRIGPNLPQAELDFLDTRRKQVKKSLERLLSKKLNGSFIPNIALVNSGGGIRALLSSLGFHIGAQKTGLLNTITYDVGLSGGAWFVSLWLMSRTQPQAFKDMIKPIMQRGILPKKSTLGEIKSVTNAVLVRSALDQPVTLVTLWGALLANRYLQNFQDNRQRVFFSSLGDRNIDQRLQNGTIPFPILTAVNGYDMDINKKRSKVNWFVFTPYEAGGIGDWLGNRNIPMWAIGRTFVHGRSNDTRPGYDLGQILGIVGSAFAPTYARAYEESVKGIPIIGPAIHFLVNKLMTSGTKYYLEKKRISVAKLPNFAKEVKNPTIAGKQNIRLVDGGLAFNLPIPPVIHPQRKADIIITFDASASLKTNEAPALKFAEEYAQNNQLPFPQIDYTNIGKKAISIFKDENNSDTPIVIYMPRSVDRTNITYPAFIPNAYTTNLSTTKFEYSNDEINQLTGVTEANLTQSMPKIIETIKWAINQKNGFE